jgi:hypothetical protein
MSITGWHKFVLRESQSFAQSLGNTARILGATFCESLPKKLPEKDRRNITANVMINAMLIALACETVHMSPESPEKHPEIVRHLHEKLSEVLLKELPSKPGYPPFAITVDEKVEE